MTQEPKCKRVVLDAGPLLSFTPLRGLAETFLTVPQVLAELKDARAREHFERLGLISGVKVEVRAPDPASLAHVIQWAKKTGDYAALSHPDLCVIALTYALHQEDQRNKELKKDIDASSSNTSDAQPSDSTPNDAGPSSVHEAAEKLAAVSLDSTTDAPPAEETTPQDAALEETDTEPLNVELVQIQVEPEEGSSTNAENIADESDGPDSPIFEDPSDEEDDGEGEWITPDNAKLHKSRAMGILPDNNKGKGRAKDEIVPSGCMTADFAMQNVLLQMGLNLVGLEGKRIERVKNWVLRCHACFKLCKDNSKKFCPSCGNPTLLRASVTVSSPNAAKNAPVMQVHLKPNFQYRIRGTKYSIPAPKPGSAKTGPGTGLILREDQIEYVRAKKRVDDKRQRQEEKALKGAMTAAAEGKTGGIGSNWMDPDWVPEILSVGAGGKGRSVRSSRMDGDMPQIGYGRKNPNERRRKK